jgi:hypothetical protein
VPFWSKRSHDERESVVPLNDAELAWVADNVAAAREAIVDAGIDATGTFTGEALDELWATLRADEIGDPNASINLVGLAFGQMLVDRFPLDWVALTDEHGTEIALRGQSDFTVFPTNFVAKRYESGDTGFLAPFVAEVARTLERLE